MGNVEVFGTAEHPWTREAIMLRLQVQLGPHFWFQEGDGEVVVGYWRRGHGGEVEAQIRVCSGSCWGEVMRSLRVASVTPKTLEGVPVSPRPRPRPREEMRHHQCTAVLHNGRTCESLALTGALWCLRHHPDRERLFQCVKCKTVMPRHRVYGLWYDRARGKPRGWYCYRCRREQQHRINAGERSAYESTMCVVCRSHPVRSGWIVCSGRCGRLLAGKLMTAGFFEIKERDDSDVDPDL